MNIDILTNIKKNYLSISNSIILIYRYNAIELRI